VLDPPKDTYAPLIRLLVQFWQLDSKYETARPLQYVDELKLLQDAQQKQPVGWRSVNADHPIHFLAQCSAALLSCWR